MGEKKQIKELTQPDVDLSKLTLGQRMKYYEYQTREYLTPKMPVFIRVDGRAFHSYVRGFDKPFDLHIMNAFAYTLLALGEEVGNLKFGYTQSDEITLFLNDFEHDSQQQWFGGNLQKIATIVSSVATAAFNEYMNDNYWGVEVARKKRKRAVFDARVYNVPMNQVVNQFIWRQLDAIKNSVSMQAQSVFSHKELLKKNSDEKKQMLISAGKPWESLSLNQQRGTGLYKIDSEVLVSNIGPKTNMENLIERGGNYYTKRSKWIIDTRLPEFIVNQDFIWNKAGMPPFEQEQFNLDELDD